MDDLLNLPLREFWVVGASNNSMKYNPDIHHRRSIRLKGYDYSSAGAYFVTICVYRRQCLLGEISDGKMHLNALGKVVQSHWLKLPQHYLHLELDAFVVMPNHIHGILILTAPATNPVGAGLADIPIPPTENPPSKPALPTIPIPPTENPPPKPAPSTIPIPPIENPPSKPALSEIIRGFKTFSARRMNQMRQMRGVSVWQRNYYEQIIRDEAALNCIRNYIHCNPQNWQQDKLRLNLPR